MEADDETPPSVVQRHKLIKPKKQAFPRKPGFRFFGSMCKESIMDDSWSHARNVPNDCLDLEFGIYVYYKIKQFNVDLRKLLKDNKEKNITLVVKGEEFPANRAILMA
ncbi:hypothetical protein TSAR_010980 [Trichomalopsis sarcophagae]|uniref:BTB domain-containing protein n=1 Tax=Trichomalopsis sarcophagae TaxID=543379 RepID=A0A232EVN2_9HYME|nr:hypothetical protein TSAR_010980 [Trichomalopsis sarcophagae]